MTYEHLKQELRAALSQTDRWNRLPTLLDELDRLRCQAGERSSSSQRQTLWVDRFAVADRDGLPRRSHA